jgi:hypothetical protein
MKELFLLAIVVMVFIVIFQIAKASEYVSVLKGEDKTRKQTNKWLFNGEFFGIWVNWCVRLQRVVF